MPTKFNSPYATSFKTAIKRGTSYNVAVNNIAKRKNRNPQIIWNSLFKAGLCSRQKFNGQWIYFPTNNVVKVKKANATTSKATQHQMWQWFCEWCIISGIATPEKFDSNTGSQAEFMTFCRKYFAKQFNGTTGRKTKTRKSSTRKGTVRKSSIRKGTVRKTRKSSSSRSTGGSNYRFPTTSKRRSVRKSSGTRKYSRAA